MDTANLRGVVRRIGLSLALVASACYGEPPGETTATVDNQALLSTLQSFDQSPAFVRLNQAAYATALAQPVYINVYVSSHAFAPYATIVPESDGSGAVVPEGTMIVREVLNEDGTVKALTLMYKGPEGYNPDLGDYWFGVTDPGGAPKVENGVMQVGRLESCYSCHAERADDDFLFGVPAATRSHPSTR